MAMFRPVQTSPFKKSGMYTTEEATTMTLEKTDGKEDRCTTKQPNLEPACHDKVYDHLQQQVKFKGTTGLQQQNFSLGVAFAAAKTPMMSACTLNTKSVCH